MIQLARNFFENLPYVQRIQAIPPEEFQNTIRTICFFAMSTDANILINGSTFTGSVWFANEMDSLLGKILLPFFMVASCSYMSMDYFTPLGQWLGNSAGFALTMAVFKNEGFPTAAISGLIGAVVCNTLFFCSSFCNTNFEEDDNPPRQVEQVEIIGV